MLNFTKDRLNTNVTSSLEVEFSPEQMVRLQENAHLHILARDGICVPTGVRVDAKTTAIFIMAFQQSQLYFLREYYAVVRFRLDEDEEKYWIVPLHNISAIDTWHCPTCSQVEVPYGKGCPNAEAGIVCPNKPPIYPSRVMLEARLTELTNMLRRFASDLEIEALLSKPWEAYLSQNNERLTGGINISDE